MRDCLLNAVLLEITEITLRGEVNTEEEMRILPPPPFLREIFIPGNQQRSGGLIKKRGNGI